MISIKSLYEPSEAEVQRAVGEYLEVLKLFWWRQQVGMATYKEENKKERRVKYGTEGASDLGCIAGGDRANNIRGTFVAIEIKKPSEHRFLIKHYDRIREGICRTKRDWHLFHQVSFIENVKDHGGEGFFASSVDDVIENFRIYGFIK